MRNRFCFTLLIIAGLLLGTTSSSAAPGATPLGTAFTYQGRLDRDGEPFTGTCDFLFGLWDAEASGTEIGSVVDIDDLVVTDGLFTAELNFGTGAFYGDARWLGVVVQCPGDASPTAFARQELTAAPYALYAAVAPWSGLTGVPSGFADEVDNDTTYTSGSGLSLSGSTFSIDPTYTQRRVSSSCTAGSAIQSIAEDGTVTCETDDNTTYLAGDGLSLSTNTFAINSSLTQRRVNGSCNVGSTIRAINADGSVTCQADSPLNRRNPPEDNVITTYSGVGYAFYMKRLLIGSDGYGFFGYFDNTAYDLMVAHCEDLECTSATITRLETGGMVGGYTSTTIGSDGLGLISYVDDSNTNLKVAHCSNVACTSADFYTIDNDGNVGLRTSITIGADGLGLISYYDRINNTLKVAHCDDTACSTAHNSTLDMVGADVYNGETNIILGWDGLGLIGYYDITNSRLRIAHCSNTECSTATLSTVATDVGSQHSLTIGPDGLGLFSYFDNGLNVAHCDNLACTSFTLSTVVVEGDIGWYPNITIGADNLPIIAYLKYGNRLAVAHCTDPTCTAVIVVAPDMAGSGNGSFSSITIGVDGLPLIIYQDQDTGTFKVLHCASIACVPYFKR